MPRGARRVVGAATVWGDGAAARCGTNAERPVLGSFGLGALSAGFDESAHIELPNASNVPNLLGCSQTRTPSHSEALGRRCAGRRQKGGSPPGPRPCRKRDNRKPCGVGGSCELRVCISVEDVERSLAGFFVHDDHAFPEEHVVAKFSGRYPV